MIVVADTSPLVVLAKIGDLSLLPALFERVLVPPEVLSELARPDWPPVVRNLATTPPLWLEIRSASMRTTIPQLHAGEAAAIDLALEVRAEIVLMDERSGRRIAESCGLRVMGVIGVLELAARQHLVDLSVAFEQIKRTDFWITHEFLDQKLRLFLEAEAERPD